ncbi:MAG: Bax inhibitor-1/YccA family protein [Isosphaeraceae bacterium]
MSSGNPAFSQDMFAGYEQVYGAPKTRSTVTTVQGTVGKTFLLLAILSFTALWSWNAVAGGTFNMTLLPISALAGFIVAMITIFRPTSAPVTAPIYAALEGVFLGALSQLIEMKYHARFPGIALQAVMLTCGTLFMMLFIYQTRLVRVTEKLQTGIIAATGAIALFYLVTMLLGFFGVKMPLVWSSQPLGIAFSLLVIGIAAFNLLLDFDFIEKAAYAGAPKYMEWYGAFGLMVTLVWLYLEILRLLQKLADRR